MFKKIKTIKQECPICEDEKELIYGKRLETLTVRREEIEVESNAYYCPAGKHYFMDLDDEEEKFQTAYREYRKRKGLLQPEEIKQIRDKYGLSQRDFARLLGFGEITIQRYESGAIQDAAHNNTLFLIKDTENFRKLFEQRKNSLIVSTIRKAEKKLKELDKARQMTLDYELKDVFKGACQETKKIPSKAFALKARPSEYIQDRYNVYAPRRKGVYALAA